MALPSRFKPLLSALAAALLVSGCATPYVVKFESFDDAKGRTMEQAMAFLNARLKTLRDARDNQIKDEHDAGNFFIGAGALITALALGDVHRDAVIGTAAVAGTGYALSNHNIPRTRLAVHEEAIKALACVKTAAQPFDIKRDQLFALKQAIKDLPTARLMLNQARDAARAARPKVPDTDPFIAEYALVDAMSIALLDESAQSLRAGQVFVGAERRAAGFVITAVEQIGDSTSSALAATSPPLSAVPGVVAGLSKDIGQFVPGAQLDVQVAEKVKSFALASSETRGTSELGKAVGQMREAAMQVQLLNDAIADELRGREATFTESAFRDCKVGAVITAVSVAPATLSFSAKAGGRRPVRLSGGVPPYFLGLDGEAVAGLSFTSGPIRNGVAEIIVAAGTSLGADVTTGVVVSDSSPAGQSTRIEVAVAASVAKDEGAASNTSTKKPLQVLGTAGGASTLDVALAALKKRSKFNHGGVEFTRQGLPARNGEKIEVIVLCPTGQTGPFQRLALAKSYLAAAGVTGFPPDRLALTTEPATCAPS